MENSSRSASRSHYSDVPPATAGAYDDERAAGDALPYDQSGYDSGAQGWGSQEAEPGTAGRYAGSGDTEKVPPYDTVYVPEPPADDAEEEPATVFRRPSRDEAPPQRKPLLDESMDKVSGLGLPARAPASPTSYMAANAPRPANQRRSPNVTRLVMLLLFMNVLMLAAFGTWFYNQITLDVETRLTDLATPAGASAPAPKPTPAPTAEKAEVAALEARLETDLGDIQTQLQATQKRLEAAELLNRQQSQSLQEVNSYLAASAGNQSPASSSTTAGGPGGATPAPAVLNLPGSQAEMVLLKERNRLTSYADEAIATGARVPYEKLWEALDDPALSSLIHGARAEILRVQNFYLSGSRIDRYDIPVASYFPDSAALKDSQLKDEELIVLLSNAKHPWQVRMKAANILGLRRSKAAGDALVKAILEDQNLDVVKEATFSFEQMSGFRSRLFEPASVKAWWDQYNASAGKP